MAEIRNVRRYNLLKMRAAARDNPGLDAVWDANRRAIQGTEIPATFPYRSRLVAAGYLVLEELDGADANELSKQAGLLDFEAAAVLAALVAVIAAL